MKQRPYLDAIYARHLAFQQGLLYLAAVRPGVPIPTAYIDAAISTDQMLERVPHIPLMEGMRAAAYKGSAEAEQIIDLLREGSERATITIAAPRRVALDSLVTEMKRSADWYRLNTPGEPISAFTAELYRVVRFQDSAYSPDHLALLAAHGLYWLEQSLERQDRDGAYCAVQLYATLWLLHERERVALCELTPLLERVLNHVACYGSGWSDPSPFAFLISLGESLATSDEAELTPWAERTFVLCKRLADGLHGPHRQFVLIGLALARRCCNL